MVKYDRAEPDPESLPILTGFFAGVAQTIGDFGLVYQTFPCLHSGSNLRAGHLYQSLPPRRRTGHRAYSHKHPAPGGWVITVDNVAHHGEP